MSNTDLIVEFTPLEYAVVTKNDKYGEEKLLVRLGENKSDKAQLIAGCLADEDQCIFLAHTANCFFELLDALEGVVRVADRKTVEFDAARAIIAKAKGVI